MTTDDLITNYRAGWRDGVNAVTEAVLAKHPRTWDKDALFTDAQSDEEPPPYRRGGWICSRCSHDTEWGHYAYVRWPCDTVRALEVTTDG